MADKKLNEVTKVTDMAYVPVIMSDGSIGQIAKADLASVVAGLIGFGLKHTSLGTPGDFNAPIDVGSYYYWGNNATNAPDGFDIAYGIRIVLFSSSNNGCFEFFHSRNNNKLYIRCGFSWTSEWKEVSLS